MANLGVCLVLPTYLPESFGGAEQQTRRYARALAATGSSVTIVAPKMKRETPAHEREGDVEVVRLPVKHAPNLGGRYAMSYLSWHQQLTRWLNDRRQSLDIIHAIHGRLHALPAIHTAKLLNKPAVVKIGRGGGAFDISVVRRKRLFGRQAAAFITRNTSMFVANSTEIEGDLHKAGVDAGRIAVIPNGVEIGPRPTPQTRVGAKFTYLGRLDREKRIDLLLKAFKELNSERETTLTIVGDGPERINLEKLHRDLGMAEGIVEFVGAVEDVGPFIRASDFYVSASNSEGMSNSLLESMSGGVVPIVSDVSGVRELVRDGENGFVFPIDDFDALVANLKRAASLSSGSFDRMALGAWQRIHDEFSIETVARRHLTLYSQLVSNH